jgi:hypothetical protein
MKVRTSRCLMVWGIILAAAAAPAEPITSMPLQTYGLGTLECAAYSPDGKYILTGGGAGAFLLGRRDGQSYPRVSWTPVSSLFGRLFAGRDEGPDGKLGRHGASLAGVRSRIGPPSLVAV